MNKKFLSAILFGALMVSSTGTFVSCKDYDDDIDNINKELTEVKSQIAALQKLVGEGKWVTNISSITNGFTVTMSDGTTQTVTGINGKDGADGKDGKPGTEWTIGDDGFWYKDGEKTTSQAVAKNGEDGKPGTNGQTAPSPEIVDGKWVVYAWNAETGEFEKKETGISAQGTSAFYVEKDGVIYLNIADETGKFAEIALPTTSDGFVVEAPYSNVIVKFDYAKWNPAASAEFKTLSAEFPEIAAIAKNTLVKQGGNLPVLVTPASVELTEDYSYSLQTIKGKTAEITVANPVKGLPANADFEEVGATETKSGNLALVTRAADASSCFWTLSIEPSIVNKEYVTLSEKPASLVVENAQGTVVKTAFAYKVESNALTSKAVTINPEGKEVGSATYAAEIDLLAYDEKQKSYPIYIENGYVGYQIITLTNKYQIEKYGLSIADDHRTLKIANMPTDVTGVTINLNVLALGLNGSTAKKDVTVKIGQEVSASENLTPKPLTLNGNNQTIKWDISELGLSAIDLDKVLNGAVNVAVTRTYTDASDKDVYEIVYNATPVYYNAAGELTTYNKDTHAWNNKEAVTFGITLNATTQATGLKEVIIGEHKYTPGAVAAPAEYNVSFTSTSGTTVIYSAETTLTTSLPEVQDAYIKLAAGFVENGVLQVIGTPNVTTQKVTYNLKEPFVLKNVKIKNFVDMDYDENETSATAASHYNWVPMVKEDGKEPVPGTDLSVNIWQTKTQKPNDWSVAEWNQLYVTRNLRANIYFFNNELNAAVYDFKAIVKSTIYSATPASVITIDGTKLVSNYGGKKIKIKDVITKAIYAAGPKKGQSYTLFEVKGTTPDPKEVADYSKVKSSDDYAVNANGAPVVIAKEDLTKLGMSAAFYAALGDKDIYHMNTDEQTLSKGEGADKIETTIAGWKQLYEVAAKYYDYNGKGEWALKKDAKVTDEDKTYVDLFNTYKGKLAFDKKTVTLDPIADQKRDTALKADPTVEFADKAEAEKYATLNGYEVAPKDVDDIQEAPEKVTIPMNLVVKDIWGMTMKVPFSVTIQTTEP